MIFCVVRKCATVLIRLWYMLPCMSSMLTIMERWWQNNLDFSVFHSNWNVLWNMDQRYLENQVNWQIVLWRDLNLCCTEWSVDNLSCLRKKQSPQKGKAFYDFGLIENILCILDIFSVCHEVIEMSTMLCTEPRCMHRCRKQKILAMYIIKEFYTPIIMTVITT